MDILFVVGAELQSVAFGAGTDDGEDVLGRQSLSREMAQQPAFQLRVCAARGVLPLTEPSRRGTRCACPRALPRASAPGNS